MSSAASSAGDARAIGLGHRRQIGHGQARGAARADLLDQLGLDRRAPSREPSRPAARRARRRRAASVSASSRQREAQHRQLAVAKLDRPVGDLRRRPLPRASPRSPCAARWSARRAAARRRRRGGGRARRAAAATSGAGGRRATWRSVAASRTSAASNEISRSCGRVEMAWASALPPWLDGAKPSSLSSAASRWRSTGTSSAGARSAALVHRPVWIDSVPSGRATMTTSSGTRRWTGEMRSALSSSSERRFADQLVDRRAGDAVVPQVEAAAQDAERRRGRRRPRPTTAWPSKVK